MPGPGFFEESPDAIVRFDAAQRVVYANPALERATALSRWEFIGRTLAEVAAFAAYAPLWQASLDAVFESQESRWFKFAVAHPVGRKLFDVRLQFELARDATGPHVTAVWRDVTVPRSALLASRAADEFARTLLTATRIGIGTLDRDLRCNAWNSYAEDLLGVAAADLMGRRLDEVPALAAVPGLVDDLDALRAGRAGGIQRGEYRTADGQWLRVQRAPVQDARGRFGGVFITLERIEHDRFAETSLAALRQALDSVGEMLFEIDAHARVLDANDTACRWLGYARDDLRGLPLAQLDTSLTPARYQAIAAQLASAGAAQGEGLYRARSGREFPVDEVFQRVQSSAGASTFVLVRDITTRKLIEQQLQVALRDQQTLFETMSVGVAQSMQGRILLANREFAHMFGYTDAEVIGMSLWDLSIDREGRMPDEVSGMPVVRPWQTTSAEVVLFRRDGEPVWCLVQARAIRADDARADDVQEAIYTFQDISEMKRHREQLSRSLLELNVVLDATSVAVLHLAGEHVIRCNAQAFQMFGGDGAGLVGQDFASFFASPGGLEHRLEQAHAALAAGETVSFETQMRGRQQPFWALVSVRAVDPRLAPSGLVCSILDISERKAQEDALQVALAQQQLIFDTALVGLLFVRDGRPVRANSAMEELLACEPGGLVTQMQLFAHPTDALLLASLAEHFDRINAQGAIEFELHMFRRKGEPIWVAVQGRAVNPERPEFGYIFAFVDIDERKRSERELRTALAELQLMFDNALVGMVYVANDLLVKANAATERLFGYDVRDLSELQVASLFADAAAWERLRADALAGHEAEGDGVIFETPMRRADGTVFWCAGNVRMIDVAAPERGMILALMDVDSRRRAAEETRWMRNYLDLVVENLPVLVSVREVASGRFVSINRAGEAMTGLRRDQIVGRTWGELYARQFAEMYGELDRRAAAGGTQVDRPRDLMLRADGRRLTVNQRVVPLYEAAADAPSALPAPPRYVMSIIDDLTEEVRAEAALRETESRFRQFAENIDQVVFILTGDFSAALYVNPRYQALVGAAPEELFENPRSVLAHVHYDDAPMVARLIPRLIARVRRLRRADFTLRLDHPQRGVRAINVRLNPVRLDDGSIRVFGIADDVTERAAAERQRMDEVVQQRDLLVREVHHRIKNNLQGVAGLLQHMATAKPEVADTLSEIAGQIQAIAQVHGLQIRATGTLPVLGVVQGIFTTLASMFGVEIRFEPPPPELWRYGLPENEAVPLALVVNELGTNAIKHRGQRADALAVRVLGRPDGLQVEIDNTGTLPPGFDLTRIASSVSGLGLVKALLPRRGARLELSQAGARVQAVLHLAPPAIREEA